jgi:hypothetical protein
MPTTTVRAKFTNNQIVAMSVWVLVRGPKTGPGKKPHGRVARAATDTTKDGTGFFEVSFDTPTPAPPKKVVIKIAGVNAQNKVLALYTAKP